MSMRRHLSRPIWRFFASGLMSRQWIVLMALAFGVSGGSRWVPTRRFLGLPWGLRHVQFSWGGCFDVRRLWCLVVGTWSTCLRSGTELFAVQGEGVGLVSY